MCAAASVIMPRSFLVKKHHGYSHCPLKKRPVLVCAEELPPASPAADDSHDDNSEPENLCTKPQDLSSASHTTPPPGLTPVPTKAPTCTTPPHNGGSPVQHHQAPASPLYSSFHQGGAFTPVGQYARAIGGPLEPLNLNTGAEHHPHAFWPPRATYQHHALHHLHAFGYPTAAAPPSYLAAAPHHHAASRDESHPRPTYVPAAHPLAAAQPPRLYHTSSYHHPHLASSTSPDLPDYYPPRGSPLHPHHATPSSPLHHAHQHHLGQHHQPPSPQPSPPHRVPSPIVCGPLSAHSADENARPEALCARLLPSSPPPMTPDSAPQEQSPTAEATAPKARHQCPDCSKSYSTFSGLSKHRQFHCKKAPGGKDPSAKAPKGQNPSAPAATFSCKHCDKTYVSLGALKMHIRTHTLPCECKLCGKAFSRPWLLQGHIRTHTGEKPFSCPHCCRAFADRSNLRAHLQTHSDVKKYSCPRCARTFSRMSLLAKHADGGGCGAAPAAPEPRKEGAEMTVVMH
ncbi:protein escargot-like [Ischnura elegans]|uniref:protein escargot-like n=1 Tax=Ischnura elegans TaxID=197161 RepID=UPI001ED89A73|nr:protein escargot-like [Ischnura elegans]